MKHLLPSLGLIIALFSAGCSSTPKEVDHGPIQASTFSFVSNTGGGSATFAESRQEVHDLVQESITRNLAAKGVTKVASGGDVTVAYLLIVGNNATTLSINDYFGYGRDATALHQEAQKAYTDSKNPNYFEAGTLVVDLIDSKTFKLLRRGHATRPVLAKPAPEARAANIQGAVDEALSGLRLGK